jgi:hypothetical protein
MLRRRREPQTIAPDEGNALDDFHEWVLSLPWVVGRPSSVDTPGVPCFGVDCELLGPAGCGLSPGCRVRSMPKASEWP